MKSFLTAVFIAAVLSPTLANVASAYTCNTSCYWLGDRQYCNTRCH